MRYQMKQKLLSWGDDFYVRDEQGTDVCFGFRRGDRVVATVSKQWLAFGDTYGIDIADGEDDVLILASAVVIDESCHPDDAGRR